MEDKTKLFLDFLFKRIETKISDLREAGTEQEIDKFCDDLESYIDGLKHVAGYAL